MRIEFEVSRDAEYYRELQRGPVSRVVRQIVVLTVILALIGPP